MKGDPLRILDIFNSLCVCACLQSFWGEGEGGRMGKRGVTLGPNHSKACSIHSCSGYTMIHPKIGS